MPPKEDRSGWVAVQSDVQDSSANAVRQATSAYTFFQKSAYDDVSIVCDLGTTWCTSFLVVPRVLRFILAHAR